MQTASPKAIIGMINGLFGTKYSPKSKISFPNTVTVNNTLGETTSDTLMLINGTDLFHVDVQIDNDFNMAVRMFLYDFEAALQFAQRNKTGDVVIDLPKSIVIYWETTRTTPDEHTVTLNFPDGDSKVYRVPTFKMLKHTLNDIEERKLALLIPFYVLKLRKQVTNALERKTKRHELLASYSQEMGKTVKQIQITLKKAVKAKLLTKADEMAIIGCVEIIIKYCYGAIHEFQEVTEMVELMTRAERLMKEQAETIARNMLNDGIPPAKVAEYTKLSVSDVEKLNKPKNSSRTRALKKAA
jgi:hypothetical protein